MEGIDPTEDAVRSLFARMRAEVDPLGDPPPTFLRRARRATVVGMGAIALAVVVLAGALVVGVQALGHSNRSAVSATSPNGGVLPVTETIAINPLSGATFAPAPASAHPALTAQQVWTIHFVRGLGASEATIPPWVKVQLGLLTVPAGPSGPNGSGAYTAHNQLVYGFSTLSGCASLNPTPSRHCIEWNFLDATTGKKIDRMWQPLTGDGPTGPQDQPAPIAIASDATFGPPPVGAHPAISEAQALNLLTDNTPQLQVTLGTYTNATFNGLVWGIRWHQCATQNSYMDNVPSNYHFPCTRWMFVDANTGKMIEERWQVGP